MSVNAYDYTEFGRTIEYEPGGEDAEGDGSGPWGALGFIDGYTIVFDVLDVQGPVTGGTASVLDGANFDPQETSCKFQMTQTAGVYVSRFRFICVTPPMPAGFVAYELIAGRGDHLWISVPLPRQGDGHAAGTSRGVPKRRRSSLGQRRKLHAPRRARADG